MGILYFYLLNLTILPLWESTFHSSVSCFGCIHWFSRASQVAQIIRKLPAMQETRICSLGWRDPLKKGMAPHSSLLAWRIPWTEEPGGLVHRVAQSRTRRKWLSTHACKVFPGGSGSRESACNVGGPGLLPGWGRASGEGNGYPLQSSCLENPKDRGAWRAIVHGVTESDMTERPTFQRK